MSEEGRGPESTRRPDANESDILISIEPLGCSTAVVFFVGFSMSKNGVLHRTVRYGLPSFVKIHTSRGG